MEFLVPSVKIIHIVISVLLVLIILLQPSKSGDIGSMFGGGSSESLFGSSGAMPFLVKMTRLLGLIFVVTSLFLGYASVKSMKGSVISDTPIESFEEVLPSDEESSEQSAQSSENVQQGEEPQEVEMDSDSESAPVVAPPETSSPGEAIESQDSGQAAEK